MRSIWPASISTPNYTHSLTWLPAYGDAGLRAVGREIVRRPRCDVLNHELGLRRNGGRLVGRRALVYSTVPLHQSRDSQIAAAETEPVRRQRLPVFLQIGGVRVSAPEAKSELHRENKGSHMKLIKWETS